METVSLQPPLFFLIDSLRGIGYTVETAIADLIDNSIAAEATEVNVIFYWDTNNPYIAITDNGWGMTDSELIDALNLSIKNPNEKRNIKDLGRFGLGLKTASFSQCKIVTVSSKKHGSISTYRWDLNELANAPAEQGLFLIKGPNNPNIKELNTLANSKHGTVVVWEDLDRIVSKNMSYDHFCAIIETVSIHLSMVFHNFIESGELTILIEKKPISPWSPFPIMTSTQKFPVVKLGRFNRVSAQGFVLPHKDKFENESMYIKAGGRGGWISQQGFYVYRNRRLLVAGSWLGLGTPRPWIKDELHELARIKVDITNEDDFEWTIDVKKSTAKPPPDCRPVLQKLGQDIRDQAKQVYVYRGKKSNPNKNIFEFAWIKEGKRYRVNTAHSIINEIIEQSGTFRKKLDILLKILEESVPVERIWLDSAENHYPNQKYTTKEEHEYMYPLIKEIIQTSMNAKRISSHEAGNIISNIEPFDQYKQIIQKAVLELSKEEN